MLHNDFFFYLFFVAGRVASLRGQHICCDCARATHVSACATAQEGDMDVCPPSSAEEAAARELVLEPAAGSSAVVRRSILKPRTADTSLHLTAEQQHPNAQMLVSGLKRRRSVQFREEVACSSCEDEAAGTHVVEPIARALSFDHIPTTCAPDGEKLHTPSDPRLRVEETCTPPLGRHADRLLAEERQAAGDVMRSSTRVRAATRAPYAVAPTLDVGGSALPAAHVSKRVGSLTSDALRVLVASNMKADAASPRAMLRRLSHLTNSSSSSTNVSGSMAAHQHALSSMNSSGMSSFATVGAAGTLSPNSKPLRGSHRAMRLQAAAMAGSPNLVPGTSPHRASLWAAVVSPVLSSSLQSPQLRPHSRSLITSCNRTAVGVDAPAGAGHLSTPPRTSAPRQPEQDALVEEEEGRVSSLADAVRVAAAAAIGDQRSSVNALPSTERVTQEAQGTRVQQVNLVYSARMTEKAPGASFAETSLPFCPAPKHEGDTVRVLSPCSPTNQRHASTTNVLHAAASAAHASPVANLLKRTHAATGGLAASPEIATPDPVLQSTMVSSRCGDLMLRDRLFAPVLSPSLPPPDVLIDPNMLSASTLPLDDDTYALESEVETDARHARPLCDATPHPALRFDESPTARVPARAPASPIARIADVHQAAPAAPAVPHPEPAVNQADNAVQMPRRAKRARGGEVDALRSSWGFWLMERREQAAKNAPLNDNALTASDEFLNSLFSDEIQVDGRRPTRRALSRAR